VLQDAIWRDRRLHLRYARSDGVAVDRDVDPLGLVAKGRLWYLVAAVEGRPRTYRVSRVRAAELLDEPAVRSPDFDLAAFWAQSSAGFVEALPRFRMTVRAAPGVEERLTTIGWFVRVERAGEPAADGWTTFDLVLHSEEEALRYALGFGGRMEVLEPQALRDLVCGRAREALALYVEDAPAPTPQSACLHTKQH
jgi:predicted DNA-binding transcriptional regulator YafY